MDSITLAKIISTDKLDSHEKIILSFLGINNTGNGSAINWKELQSITGLGLKKTKDCVEKLIQNNLLVVTTERARKRIVETNEEIIFKPEFVTQNLVVEQKKKETNPDLGLIWTHAKDLGFPKDGDGQTNRRFSYLLYRKEGLEETKKLISAAVELWSANDKYAPAITSFSDLYYKAGKLRIYFYRQENSIEKI